MKRKFYKKIRSEKTADGLNRLSLLSVYSNNCSEQNYVDVNDETLEDLKSLARYQRRQDSKDYRNLSIYPMIVLPILPLLSKMNMLQN